MTLRSIYLFLFKPSNIVKIEKLSRHYHETFDILLHSAFQTLKTFIEDEYQDEFDFDILNPRLSDLNSNLKHHAVNVYSDVMHIEYNSADSTILYKTCSEILFLYYWYTKIEDGCWESISIDRETLDYFMQDTNETTLDIFKKYMDFNNMSFGPIDDINDKEKYENEMLIRLVNVRKYLWT